LHPTIQIHQGLIQWLIYIGPHSAGPKTMPCPCRHYRPEAQYKHGTTTGYAR
jgi:hypothetical protein